jgi:RNA polymerase primary sigma factor
MEVGARRGAHFQQRTSITMITSPSRQQSRVYEPMGMPQATSTSVLQFFVVSGISRSLDAPIGDDDDSTKFSEVIGDENLRNEMGGLLKVLDNRGKKIISKRFGLDGGKSKTLEDVGKDFGITRERIRQLQNIALAKLRRALSKREDPLVPA